MSEEAIPMTLLGGIGKLIGPVIGAATVFGVATAESGDGDVSIWMTPSVAISMRG